MHIDEWRPLAERFNLVPALLSDTAARNMALLPAASARMLEPQAASARYDLAPGGIAVIPIAGTLIANHGGMNPWLTGYDAIEAQLALAVADPSVSGIALVVDSHGGQVSGCFECADAIAARFNSRLARGLAAVAMLVAIVGYMATNILALGLVVDAIFGTGLAAGLWIGMAITLAYSVSGGILAGVYTDLFQGAVMALASVLVFLYTLEVGTDPDDDVPENNQRPFVLFRSFQSDHPLRRIRPSADPVWCLRTLWFRG